MRTVRSVSLPLIVVAATSAVSAFGQPAQQPPTFRANTNVVQVDVRVFKGDQFVRGLGPDDFVLTEDGVPQTIESAVLVGATPAEGEAAHASTRVPASNSTQASPDVTPSAPSVWIFVFDMWHLSPAGLNRTRKAVLQFLDDKWHQGDFGGVVSDGKMDHNRITSDRAELRADVAALKMPGDLASFRMDMTVESPRFQDEFEVLKVGVDEDPETLKNVVRRACDEEPDECFRTDPTQRVLEKAHVLARELRQSSLSTIGTVVALSNALVRVPGPKTVVFLSEGFAIDTMESQLRDSVGDAARAGAHFYTIDARGLNRGSASSSLFTQPVVESLLGKTPRFDVVVDGITSLAVDTGGMIIKNENDLGRALGEIQRDASTYYVIAYTPTNTNFDGKYRVIDVSVTRPGVHVRARRGYLALPAAMLLTPKPVPAVAAGVAQRLRPSEILNYDFVRTARASLRKASAPAAGDAIKGFDAFAQSDYARASSELSHSLKLDQSNAAVAFVLGWAEEAVGDERQAIGAWRAAAAIDPKMLPAYLALANAYIRIGQRALAEQALRAGLAALPNSTELRAKLGEVQKGG
jgi:VWFA-related protein